MTSKWQALWMVTAATGLLMITETVRADAMPKVERAARGGVAVMPLQMLREAAAGAELSVEMSTSGLDDLTLNLRRIPVASPTLRVVRGADRDPMTYDASRLKAFEGQVAGRSGSHVFITVAPGLTTGRIDLADGRAPLRVSHRGAGGGTLGADRVSLFPEEEGGDPGVAMCGLVDGVAPAEGGVAGGGVVDPPYSHKLMEIAIETDHELYLLFNDSQQVVDYVMALFAEIGVVYRRDVGASFQVVFVRVWDTPDDLFNEPDPLVPFRNYWNSNMTDVDRDLAALLSGRRDLPYGGVAYLSSVCSSSGYSVNGYLTGDFPHPDEPASGSYGLRVVAHEIGHNCASPHTPNYSPPIDQCFPPPTVPQRGTLMSYCSQTVSGGRHVNDRRFHRRVQQVMREFLEGAACVAEDCNFNGIEDGTDIDEGTSADANNNGIPDECEDCNDNGTFDMTEVFTGSADDVNGNGLPDECEADCNGNGLPDRYEIEEGTIVDAYGNNIPDVCEEDCNNNGTADYTEIQQDLTLDINRNARLDACDDCDADGTIDAVALNHAHNAWIAGEASPVLGEFHARTGVRAGTADEVGATALADVAITDDLRVLASSPSTGSVLEFDIEGHAAGTFIAPGAGGLTTPRFMVRHPNGNLLVGDAGNDSVLEYDGVSGSFVRTFVAPGAGGLDETSGLAFGPDGDLYVGSAAAHEVLRFDGTTGSFDLVFVERTNNGGLQAPAGMTFLPDGRLIVAGFLSDDIHAYDGETGEPLGSFAYGGTLYGPYGVKVGPNGRVFVTRDEQGTTQVAGSASGDDVQRLHVTTTRLYEYDAFNGYVLGSYIVGDDTDLYRPRGFAFVPGWSTDCNVNYIPDACDIQSGFSEDVDQDGTPDECQVDCNANGIPDRLDLIPSGPEFDCNNNRIPDSCDVQAGTGSDCDGNGRLDECEADCNGNGVNDICDVSGGTSDDCNANMIPDECEADCNGNGTADSCDIAGGSSPDCDASGIPDECELVFLSTTTLESTEPLGTPNVIAFDVPAGPVPVGDVTLTISAIADLASSSETINVYLDGSPVGTIFNTGGNDCPNGSGPVTVTIERNDWLDAATDPDATLEFAPSATVDASVCNGNTLLTVVIGYDADGDCDASGTPDVCEPAGDDCDADGFPDACAIAEGFVLDCNQNGLPDSCDIDGGGSMDANGNGVPDECDPQAPLGEDALTLSCILDGDCPNQASCIGGACYVPKNRYLSITPNPENAGNLTARRVSFAPDGLVLTTLGWCGPPNAAGIADLQPDPYYADWSAGGAIHVRDCGIEPGRVYVVQAIAIGAPTADELSFSLPLPLPTATVWGDATAGAVGPTWLPPDGDVNFVDILAVVQGFLEVPTAPPLHWVDMEGLIPNGVVNFADIQFAISAYQGQLYPNLDACTCAGLPPCPTDQ